MKSEVCSKIYEWKGRRLVDELSVLYYTKSILESYFEKSCISCIMYLIYKCLRFPTGRKLRFFPRELQFLLMETRVSFSGNSSFL